MKGDKMNKLLNIYTAPSKVFTSLKEKPEWITPFIIVLVVIAIIAALTVGITKATIMANQEELLRERGMSEEQIEQTMKLTAGPIPMISSAIAAAIFIALALLIFTVVLNLFIPMFGGKGAFKNVFSVVCFSSLIKVPGAILKLILIAITKSPYVATSLALFVPNLAKNSFGYLFLNGIDFFVLWEMILVAIGISITNDIKKNNAYILVFIIWLISIFIGIGLGRLGPGR
jgi:hypothetical protein